MPDAEIPAEAPVAGADGIAGEDATPEVEASSVSESAAADAEAPTIVEDDGAATEPSVPIVPDEVLLAAVDLARGALLEVTAPQTVGSVIGHVADGERVLSMHFAADLAGYPGWHWSVTLARLEDAEPTVLETELLPGERALLAPEWVPWSERLADYRAAQAAAAEAGSSTDDEEDDGDAADEDALDDELDDDALDDDELDDDELDDDEADVGSTDDVGDEFGDEDAGDDVFDGIDIDALDADADADGDDDASPGPVDDREPDEAEDAADDDGRVD